MAPDEETEDAWVLDAEFRVVRRTTTSTVVSVHPSARAENGS